MRLGHESAPCHRGSLERRASRHHGRLCVRLLAMRATQSALGYRVAIRSRLRRALLRSRGYAAALMKSWPRTALAALTFSLAAGAIGCPCVRSVVNGNEGLRWWLFANFGADRLCPELLDRGVPLKVPALSQSSVGRFFPQQCQVSVDDARRTMRVAIAGDGYAYLPTARRIGFTCAASIEYRPDFRMEADATYVWGVYAQMLSGPEVNITSIETGVVDLAARLPFVNELVSAVGRGLVEAEITKGFTVVRSDEGDGFTFGILQPPQRPPQPYAFAQRRLIAGDTVEVHPASRELIGPLRIHEGGQALHVRLDVSGASLQMSVVDRTTGEQLRQQYEAGAAPAPPPSPLAASVVPLGSTERIALLPPGSYYVLLDNGAAPPLLPLPVSLPVPILAAEAKATVTYAIETADR